MDEIGGDPGASPQNLGDLLGLLDKGDRLIAKVAQKLPPLGRLLGHTALTTRGILLAFLGLFLLLVLPPLIGWLLRRFKRVEPNFRREWIPQSYGIVILAWSSLMLAASAWLFPASRPALLPWLLTVGGFGVLGFIDDTWGSRDRDIKGLQGHFRAAFRERKITTGFVKAVGGGLLALLVGWLAFPGRPLPAVFAAALIALSANALNLLDLRPGRAGAAFLLASLPLMGIAIAAAKSVPPLLYVFLPALLVYDRDARAKVMMGDAGSNLLGAALGLALATAPLPRWIQAAALLLLIAFHVLTERVSLTALIEKHPALRALDRLTGVR